jgi:5-hydroxyisourate hydrolase
MPRLTTHVLDAAVGTPAVGLRVVLTSDDKVLADTVANDDGRAGPLIEGHAFARGDYKLAFHVGDYFHRTGAPLAEPAFLDVVPVRFSFDGEIDAHVPLLISPYAIRSIAGVEIR